MKSLKKKSEKISRGYRLLPATHNLINMIQELIRGDQEMAIGNACRKYYKSLLDKNKNLSIK